MASRFFESNDDDVSFFRDASTSLETKKSTNTWVRIFQSWARARNNNEDMSSYPPAQLNQTLEKFYVELRKKNGDTYEPACLRVMIAAFDRHLREKCYEASLLKGREFASSREVLEGVARELRKAGKGNLPNRARSMDNDEIEELWSSGELGTHNPRALNNTVFYTVCMGLAMRGREKHHSMKIQDFEYRKDNSGKVFIYYRYGNTKTNPSGLNFKPKKISGRLYETGDDRCPVKLFRELIAHRPSSMKTSGPLYLAVIDRPKTNVWFKTGPLGVHSINNMVKRMKQNCPALKSLPKKLTNHTMRKTAVRKLRGKGFQKAEIKNVTGHSRAEGLDAYDSGDDDELMGMSMALLRDEAANSVGPSTSTSTTPSASLVVPPVQPEPSGRWTNYFAEMEKSQRNITRLQTDLNFIPSFNLLPPLFGGKSSSSSHPAATQHYHIAPCTINIYTGAPPAEAPNNSK